MRFLLGEATPDAFSGEGKTSCARCALWPVPGDDPAGVRTFTEVRCCTYHPRIPNFMVGRALSAGGQPAELLRARIARRDGVGDLGIEGPGPHRRRYEAVSDEDFGRDTSLRCPFWVEGPLSCGLHGFRGAVCRTWHCRYDAGERGYRAWMALQGLLIDIEKALALRCASVRPSPWVWEGDAVWEDYFIACAAAVDAIDAAELSALSATLTGHRIALSTELARRDAPMPERLRTNGHRVEPSVSGVWRVAGYSPWDPVEAPREVGVLLALLAEGGSWRQAVQAVAQRTGQQLTPRLIRALWCAEILREEPDPQGTTG